MPFSLPGGRKRKRLTVAKSEILARDRAKLVLPLNGGRIRIPNRSSFW
jgi:hypothetical protein